MALSRNDQHETKTREESRSSEAEIKQVPEAKERDVLQKRKDDDWLAVDRMINEGGSRWRSKQGNQGNPVPER